MPRIDAVVLAFSALVAVGGCGPVEKFRLDREVDRLCAIDGGVHVYETVRLAKEDFGADGEVFPQFRSMPLESGRYGSKYFATLDRQTLVAGDPSLVKSTIRIIRRSDGKILAQQINYVRGGGDLPGPWASSTHQCKQVLKPQQPLTSVFVKEE